MPKLLSTRSSIEFKKGQETMPVTNNFMPNHLEMDQFKVYYPEEYFRKTGYSQPPKLEAFSNLKKRKSEPKIKYKNSSKISKTFFQR